MSNYLKAKEELLIYIKARTPFIVIESSERERVENMLRELSDEAHLTIDYYTDAKQLITIGGKTNAATDVNHDPLSFGFEQFKRHKHQVFAIGDITKIDSDNAYSREFLNLLYMAKESVSTVIIITADTIWSRLSTLGVTVRLDFPDQAEIEAIIKEYVRQYSGRFTIDWTKKDITQVATLLKGFSEIQLENVLSTELIANNGLFAENIGRLVKKKDRLFGSIGAVQSIKLPDNISVSGMGNLKSWLLQKKDIFYASDETLHHYDLKVPKGILLAGVPGCGVLSVVMGKVGDMTNLRYAFFVVPICYILLAILVGWDYFICGGRRTSAQLAAGSVGKPDPLPGAKS